VVVADSWFGKNPVCVTVVTVAGIRLQLRWCRKCNATTNDDDDDTKRAGVFHLCPHTGLMSDMLCHGDV
jgi:hypothetical protein